jgi:hypothetical protein
VRVTRERLGNRTNTQTALLHNIYSIIDLKKKACHIRIKMLYMPATTFATPIVLQETQQIPLQATTQYYMFQPTTIIPAVPLFNTTLVYPRYGFLTQSVETSIKKDEIDKSHLNQSISEVLNQSFSICLFRYTTCNTSSCSNLFG